MIPGIPRRVGRCNSYPVCLGHHGARFTDTLPLSLVLREMDQPAGVWVGKGPGVSLAEGGGGAS